MENQKTWYTVKDGKIDRVQILRENERPLPEDKDWIQSPTNNVLIPETPIERYDENMRYLLIDEWLEKQGKKDNSGRWYHKERTKEDVMVYDPEEAGPGDEYTQVPPIKDEPFQKWDEVTNKWKVETEKKERAEKQGRLSQMKSEIENAERKQIRSMKAIIRDEATEDDTETFNRYEEIIQTLRPQISALEQELKSA